MSDQQLAIGELARRTGVAVSALRYYEQAGLMPPASRVSGQRRYPASAVRLVGVILLLREAGFSVREMRPLMAALRSHSLAGWRDLARHKIANLDQRIAKAQAARSALQHALACPHADLVDCPNFTAAVEARLASTPLEKSHPH